MPARQWVRYCRTCRKLSRLTYRCTECQQDLTDSTSRIIPDPRTDDLPNGSEDRRNEPRKNGVMHE